MRQYYYSKNNQEQVGPISLAELQTAGISPDTLIWYDGLSNWIPANQVSELQFLFQPSSGVPSMPSTHNPYAQQGQDLLNPRGSGVPPKTYLVEAILVTLFCFWPFGIPAIINASKVEKLFYQGNIIGAEAASRKAKMWVLVNVYTVVGLIIIVFLFIAVSYLFANN